MIILKPLHNKEEKIALYEVFFKDKDLGWFVQDVDGFYYYQPNDDKCLWSSYSMRWIADKLDEVNKPWNDYINENLTE